MKEHPILFSGEMVRAILEGRKTQTRRVIKQDRLLQLQTEAGIITHDTNWSPLYRFCHLGQIGDRLWVRETFWHYGLGSELGGRQLYYKCDMDLPAEFQIDHFMKWKPSIFMPRWASRITLEITDIRIERLQEISKNDACAEGIQLLTEDFDTATTHIEKYRMLWDELNAKRGYSWASNPWVWVIEFQRKED